MFSRKNTFMISAGISALFLAVVAGFIFIPRFASATGVSGDLHGYAWSDTLGWVKLNCADAPNDCGTGGSHAYKVTVTNDIFSGYAWSDTVGWISFNSGATGVSACGTGHPGTLDDTNTTSANITGWARVVSGTTLSGADGCISLSGTSYGLRYDPTTTSTFYTGHPLTGYAWGSVSMGWLNFDYASLDGGSSGPSLIVTKNTSYADQTVAPGTSYEEIGSFKVQNTSTSEDVGFDSMTVAISATGMSLSDLTNLKMTISTAPVGSTIPTITSPTNSINGAPATVSSTATPSTNTVEVDVFADIGTATSGHLNTTLIATGTGTHSGTSYSSGTAVTGQTITIGSPLPPNTVVLKINGSTLSSFPTSAGGNATVSWSAASNVTSCTPVADTFTGATETYWTASTPAINLVSHTLPSSSIGPETIPAFIGSGLTPNKHILGLNCMTSGGPLSEVTAEVDVPSPASSPTLNFQVNFLPSFTFPDNTAGSASLSWTSTGMTSCAVDTTGASPNTLPGGSGWNLSTAGIGLNSSLFAVTVPANTSTTTPVNYTLGLRCTGLGGTVTRFVTITVPFVGSVPGTTAGGTSGTSGPTTQPWKEL